MKTIATCIVVLAALTSSAQANLRERCVATTGASSGPAYNTCMSEGRANLSTRKGPLYRDPAYRIRCRMQANC